MVIKYADGATIARCVVEDGVGEVKFASLRELLEAETIDGLCLSRDWDRIEHIVVNATFDLDSKYDRSDLGVEALINRCDSAVSRKGTRFVHSGFIEPSEWGYIVYREDPETNFRSSDVAVSFLGFAWVGSDWSWCAVSPNGRIRIGDEVYPYYGAQTRVRKRMASMTGIPTCQFLS